MTKTKSTKFTLNNQVASITLCNPEKHNAFDDRIISELRTHIQNVREDQSIRVLLLKAEGKHFCAGADLAWMKRMAKLNHQENLGDARHLASLMSELNALPIPTIVRVQGAAYGGAIGLIACCDIAIASDNSRFCLSEVKLGLAPATIGPYVVKAMGARISKKLFLTAEVFNSKSAFDHKLLHEVVPLDQLDQQVETTISQILTTGPMASRSAKKLIEDIEIGGSELAEKTSDLIATLRVSEEGQEGLGAFFEKRKPTWCISELAEHNTTKSEQE